MDSIIYQGHVKIIKRYRGKYRSTLERHNSGTEILFSKLREVLLKGTVDNIMPMWLDIGYTKDSNWITVLQSKVAWTRRGTSSRNTTQVAQFIWNLAYNNFNSSALTDKASRADTKVIPLYIKAFGGTKDGPKDEPLMEVNLDLTDYKIVQGESHEIYWSMAFVNTSTSTDQSTEAGGN